MISAAPSSKEKNGASVLTVSPAAIGGDSLLEAIYHGVARSINGPAVCLACYQSDHQINELLAASYGHP